MVVVLVGGSRSLPPQGLQVCSQVASALAASGASFVTGCAVGADAALGSALAAAGCAVTVFSATGSAPAWAQVVGVPVVPSGLAAAAPLRARLAARSAAAAARAASGVFIVSRPDSKGSLKTASLLAARGCPVRFFTVGFDGPPAPLPGQAGGWFTAGAVGSAAAWAWLVNASDLLL